MAGRENSSAFQPGEIGGMTLKNRLVRSATHDGMATENGEVTDAQVRLYETLAEGGVGLIVSGAAAAHSSGASLHNMMRVTDDSCLGGNRSAVKSGPRCE